MEEQTTQVKISGYQKRSFKNWVLQPYLQVKLGIYSIFLAISLSASLAAIIYLQLNQFVIAIIQLTDIEDEVRVLLSEAWDRTRWWMTAILIAFVIANIAISIISTHRLVGPTVAFRRHIQELSRGNYSAKTVLRKHDAFREVGDELNALSDILAEKQEGTAATSHAS
jgi:nitrate/nitrite-specific signal transduction histidine kinase